MQKIFLALLFLLIPSLVFADIAGPVLTKNQACREQDGASMNRLQIFLNGKKSDTLYFYKKENSLFYIVPMFPYSQKKYDPAYGYLQGTYIYYAGLFLYQYDCTNQRISLVSTQNLKKLVQKITYGSGEGDYEVATMSDIQGLNVGTIISVSRSSIMLSLSQTQTPGQVILTIKK